MKKKALGTLVAAVAALSVFASSALAENGEVIVTNNGPIPAHKIQTPTGPITVPDEPNMHGTLPNGETWEVEGVLCGYASEEQASHYTHAELEADIENWCFQDPGTIPVPASLAKAHGKKAAHKATKAAKHHRKARH